MDDDKVLKYLKELCNNKDLVEKYENEVIDVIDRNTTKKDLKTDFLILFAISIYDQRITSGFAKKLYGKKTHGIDEKIASIHNVDDFIVLMKNLCKKHKQKSKGILESISKFKKFLDKISKKDMESYDLFEKSLIKHFKIKKTDNLKGIFSGKKIFRFMGEKTAGLFLKYILYYTTINNVGNWKKETHKFCTFGIGENYIKEFINDIYNYYGNELFKCGLYKNFKIKSPINLDIVREAYINGKLGFKNFIDDKK